MMHIFHKWGQWEQSVKEMSRVYDGVLCSEELKGKILKYKEEWQRRKCEICGKVEEQEI